MDRILIEGLSIDAIIGVHDRERTQRQPVVLDIDVGIDSAHAAASDELRDTVSYGDIARAVTRYVEESSFELIEALAEHVASLLLEQFNIADVRLKLAKPEAVANARQVAIVLERSRTGASRTGASRTGASRTGRSRTGASRTGGSPTR